MDTNKMEIWCRNARFLTEEEFADCMIKPEDDGDVCEDKIKRVCSCFPSDSLSAWNYFRDIYADIPDNHKMRCLLNCVYQSYKIDYVGILEMISEYLANEGPELKKQRIEANRTLLNEAGVEDTEHIHVFRGIAENNMLPNFAVSWSLSEEIAEWFIKHHKSRHGARFGFVANQTIGIEDVLYYSDARKEQEVYTVPSVVHEGCLPEYDEDLGILDYNGYDEYQWYVLQHEGWDEEPEDLFDEFEDFMF